MSVSSIPDDGPLAAFAHADRIDPDIGSREWRLSTQRLHGRSHALVLAEGKGVARLAQGQVRLAGPCLLWLPPGVGQLIDIGPGSAGCMMSFAEDLVSRAVTGHRASGELRAVADRLVHAEGAAQIRALSHAGAAIHQELRALEPGGMTMVVSYLTVILVHAWRLAGFQTAEAGAGGPGSVISQRFLDAVELHFRENWPIATYADQLGVTERRLHGAVTKAMGKSPIQLLHLRTLQEARARLERSSLAIAQIGYGLGFRDPAHFSRFFKTMTGQSPGAFRRACRQESRRDTTFAAWP